MMVLTMIRKWLLFFIIFLSVGYVTVPVCSQEADAQKEAEKKEDSLTEQLKKEIEILKLQKEYLEAKSNLEQEKQKGKNKALLKKIKELQLQNTLELEEDKKKNRAIKEETSKIQLQLNKYRLNSTKTLDKMKKLEYRLFELETSIQKEKKESEYKKIASGPVRYPLNPVYKNKIVISDRRITLDGAITYESAREVTEAIHFYNNQSEKKPIFLVIESSPGGSVMAGYQILTAMKSSNAPIYVVVKAYAASMAAVITTSADKSYALKNAIILHHQIRGDNYGNLTQQKEMLEFIEEWSDRIIGPIAQKMGISIKAFIKKMYEHNSDGDWMEFGDKAVKLKWITATVDYIEDESYRKKPEYRDRSLFLQKNTSLESNEKGNAQYALPVLRPFDVYHLYDPSGRYKMNR